jgi:queuosine precursor transporter
MSQLITDPVVSANQPHKYLTVFAMLWITFLLLTVFTTLKTFELYGVVFFAAVIAYPMTYIFSDIFTEVYGYRVSRKIIWTGFLCLTIASSLAYLYTLIPPSQYFTPTENDAFNLIFRASPYITFASIVAFWAGENVNSIILAKLKLWTKGKRQGFRYIVSTFLGQTADNIVGVSIIVLIANLFTFQEAWQGIITTIVFCTVWEIVALPLTYFAVRKIKKAEGLDTYDEGTNLNPFALKSQS